MREHPLPPRRAAELVREVADAVAYAHAKECCTATSSPRTCLLDANGPSARDRLRPGSRVEGKARLTRTGASARHAQLHAARAGSGRAGGSGGGCVFTRGGTL